MHDKRRSRPENLREEKIGRPKYARKNDIKSGFQLKRVQQYGLVIVARWPPVSAVMNFESRGIKELLR
jgi:hypothetical protein